MTPHALIAPARLAGAPLLRGQSDERLVDLVRAGNDAAFEAIVSRYRRPLLRYCSGFMSEARAEDAVQTALVSAFDSLRRSSGQMNLRPWLYRIAHNTALNALRDRSLQHEELSDRLDGVERPDQAFERSQGLRDVLSAVSALPERQRDAIVLRELEGRSYEEIAADLGVSDGSVRQLLNRGRNTLRAGMTAVTPASLLSRVPWGGAPGEEMATRVAEMCGAGAGAALLTKVCATAIVTGAVVGGVASAPSGSLEQGSARPDGQREGAAARVVGIARPNGTHESGAGGASKTSGGDSGGRDDGYRGRQEDAGESSGSDRSRDRAERREESTEDDDRRGRDGGDSSGPGSGEDDAGDDGGRELDRSGSDDPVDSSGPGSGDDFVTEPFEVEEDRSGSGSGDSGSGSGSGSGDSGSGGSGSGGSGSGGSGSGSGSGSSGSGSGDSGSGSSGSGSGSY